jgi:hypothetical protein
MYLYTKPPQQFYPAPAGSEKKNERIRVGSKMWKYAVWADEIMSPK